MGMFESLVGFKGNEGGGGGEVVGAVGPRHQIFYNNLIIYYDNDY